MNNNYEIKLEKKKQKHFYLFEEMWGYNVWFQKISMPPPPPPPPTEDHWKFQGGGGVQRQ